MLDKSEQELNAVDLAFNTPCYVPEQELNAVDRAVKPLLCDFHRLQAWNRWIKKGENGVPEWAQGRPHVVVVSLMQRSNKARDMTAQVHDQGGGVYLVEKSEMTLKVMHHNARRHGWISSDASFSDFVVDLKGIWRMSRGASRCPETAGDV